MALLLAIVLAVRLRRMRAAQSAVMGAQGSQDLVTYVQSVGDGFTDLREWVEGALAQVDERLAAPASASTAASHTARSSATTPTARCRATSPARWPCSTRASPGVVISSILHRDQARVYVKQVTDGVPSLELSPEEQEAVDTALAGGVHTTA